MRCQYLTDGRCLTQTSTGYNEGACALWDRTCHRRRGRYYTKRRRFCEDLFGALTMLMIIGIPLLSQGARCADASVDSMRATNVLVVQLLLLLFLASIVAIGGCSGATVGLVVAGIGDDGSDVRSG